MGNTQYLNLMDTKKHANELVALYKKQAYEKFNMGDYISKGSNGYGEVISIDVLIRGIGNKKGKSVMLKTGWLINTDGSIKLTTPFVGF